jgi:flagellar biosynthesis protein FlhF
MHLKRYRRPTVKEALRAVREDLGPNALVLSTAMVPALGMRGWLGAREVEVTAAAERLPVSENRHLDPPQPKAKVDTPQIDEVTARLQATGIDAELARNVAEAMPAGKRRGATPDTMRTALTEQLVALAAADEGYAPIEVFVGPPGVGKTTTIAKIAAQERARHGTRLGLLAADGFRVGAVEQLRLFADIIGAPFAVARSADELAEAVSSTRRPLLLDTAGRSPNDDASREMFRVLSQRRDVRTHLVLPASSTPATARRAIERFADARPTRLVLTKLDEADSIGPLLGVVRDSGLPFSYLGTGQSVPEDLQRATAANLAGFVMGEGCRIGAVA